MEATGGWTPACETVKRAPPIRIVPVRELCEEFGATVYCTAPKPAPSDPEVTVIQDASLRAPHVAEETLTAPAPPPASIATALGVSVIGKMAVTGAIRTPWPYVDAYRVSPAQAIPENW